MAKTYEGIEIEQLQNKQDHLNLHKNFKETAGIYRKGRSGYWWTR